MLIRSQNKKMLLNICNTLGLSATTKNQIMATYPLDDAYDYIGEYTTEAKAIKVLDMIQKHVDYLRITSLGGGSIYDIDETFQMPLDEKVSE